MGDELKEILAAVFVVFGDLEVDCRFVDSTSSFSAVLDACRECGVDGADDLAGALVGGIVEEDLDLCWGGDISAIEDASDIAGDAIGLNAWFCKGVEEEWSFGFADDMGLVVGVCRWRPDAEFGGPEFAAFKACGVDGADIDIVAVAWS